MRPQPKQLYFPELAPHGVMLEGAEAIAFAKEYGCWLRAETGRLVDPKEAQRIVTSIGPTSVWVPTEPEWAANDADQALELAVLSGMSVVVLAFSSMEGVIAGGALTRAAHRLEPSRLILGPSGLCLELGEGTGRFHVRVLHAAVPKLRVESVGNAGCLGGGSVGRKEGATS